MSLFPIQKNGGEVIQYSYTAIEVYIGRGHMSSQPNHQFPCHWHEDVEFAAILSGEMEYNVNGNVFTVHEGETVFINSRQLHFHYTTEKNDCEYICFLFHPMLLRINPVFEEKFAAPILNNDSLSYMKLPGQLSWQKEIWYEIQKIYEEKSLPAAPLLVQSHLYKIWANLFDGTEMIQNQKGNRENLKIMKSMISYIQKNYMEKLTLSEIAASGAVGQSKCCALFKDYIRVTPVAYLNQYRLNKSRELLTDTDMTVSEISEAVGFSGASYYTESFRRYYGQTPTEYRYQNFT